jgi:(p)ppGpp synthase/HD superfamily hydrolase
MKKGNIMSNFVSGRNTLINQAIKFATTAHGDQVRKGNEFIPYIFHPIDVANEVIYYSGLNEAEVQTASIIAILHDVVEDTSVSIDEVISEFGSTVASGVQFLSKDDSVPQPEQLRENLSRLVVAPNFVQAIKLADRVSNLKAFPAMWDRARIGKYLDDSALISQRLGDASETLNARLLMRVAENRMKLSLYKNG